MGLGLNFLDGRHSPASSARAAAAISGSSEYNTATLVTPTFRLPVPKLYLTTISSEWNRASGAGIRPNQEFKSHDCTAKNERNGGQPAMHTPPVLSPQAWEAAREQLLVEERAQTRARDALAAELIARVPGGSSEGPRRSQRLSQL